MKIKTITCHDVYNYGASLQAYALQQYLSSQGHDVEIIDYKPEYMKCTYDFWFIPFSPKLRALSEKYFIVKLLLSIKHRIAAFRTLQRRDSFDQFKHSKLNCTSIYSSIKDLRQNPPMADVYIAGSDQIWNPYLSNGHDASFFLQFGSPCIKRISYAASFGVNEYNKENMDHMIEWLFSFNAISVREKAGLSLLRSLNINDAIEVVDPVFLIPAEEWSILAKQSQIETSEPYILVYDIFIDDIALKKAAINLARKHNLMLIAINDYKTVGYVDKNINNAGPIEFLDLIKNAEFVISNSFHATAISIIFNRDFFVYYSKPNVSRMKNILTNISCDDRLNSDSINKVAAINWSIVNDTIGSLVEKSKRYIADNL